MKKLFLVDGAAGLIKSDLIQFILSKENSILVKKYSTRVERNTDSKNIDLKFISNEEFSKIEKECYCYNYGKKDDGYGNARYGIPKKSLMEAVDSFENVFVIVRNLDRINEIIKDYSRKVKVISVLIYADKQFTSERLKLAGREDEIPTRLN